MTVTDEALLVLIIDDAIALRVMAAWGAAALPLSAMDDPRAMARLAAVSGTTQAGVEAALPRLHAARVLVDGGITELGDRLLQQRVRSAISGSPATSKRGRR